MGFTLTPNMSLPVPTVDTEPGPLYATDINNSLTIVDQHNHSAGSGVQITPSGLNINTTLSFNNNYASSVAGLVLTKQTSAPATTDTLYDNSGDLYFVDTLGNNIQITKSGAVAGTPGSIANLASPASATYVSASSTFVFQSNTSIAANLDAASILIRNISPNSTNAITLQAPAALSSNYNIVLPALPSTSALMALDASGNISAPYSISGGLSGSVLAAGSVTSTQIATATIATSNMAAQSVTNTILAPLNIVTATQTGGAFTFTGSITLIPGLSASITTVGRPVQVSLQDGAFTASTGSATVLVFRDGTQITGVTYSGTITLPSTILNVVDVVTAGTHTYQIRAVNGTSGPNAQALATIKLVVREL